MQGFDAADQGVVTVDEEGEEVAADEPPAVEQRRTDEYDRVGRNDPCPCGSGLKYKKCHGA